MNATNSHFLCLHAKIVWGDWRRARNLIKIKSVRVAVIFCCLFTFKSFSRRAWRHSRQAINFKRQTPSAFFLLQPFQVCYSFPKPSRELFFIFLVSIERTNEPRTKLFLTLISFLLKPGPEHLNLITNSRSQAFFAAFFHPPLAESKSETLFACCPELFLQSKDFELPFDRFNFFFFLFVFVLPPSSMYVMEEK